eukprot:scaffold116738_cov64-Phaeocystis_antarctica.AAC.6
MNVETCGHVADLTVMAHAFAELRDRVVARQHENDTSLTSVACAVIAAHCLGASAAGPPTKARTAAGPLAAAAA